MSTIQTNVRVEPDDKPLVRAVAARLRIEPHFRERLKALLEDELTPALRERLEKLEEQVEWLLSGGAATQPALQAGAIAVPRHAAGNGNGSHAV
jgi:hypothetical protein